jgi:RNA ligase (TIGR02306 family)
MNLATVERVVSVTHHPNADKLDIIKVLGYDAIVGRDQYKAGDLVIFIQPDSILPSDKAWATEFLRYTSRGRLRAVRLRGEWSMGLVLPLTTNASYGCWEVDEGDDLTEDLGITKYEPPLPLNTQARGGLPFQIPRTDEERWQNIRGLEKMFDSGVIVDVTQKIDGQSATFYCVLANHWPGEGATKVGITSRSLDLRIGKDEEGNEFDSNWHKAERRYNILQKLQSYCERHNVSLALRGEVFGAGIQSFAHNPHSKGAIDFAAFSVYNIGEKRYERIDDAHYVDQVAYELEIPLVPVVESEVELTKEIIDWYDHGTKTLFGEPFEGVVIQHAGGSFKVISKWYDADKE